MDLPEELLSDKSGIKEYLKYCEENKCIQCRANYTEFLKRVDIQFWIYKKYKNIDHECNWSAW